MTDIAVESLDVFKKFKKGELYDSLRDFVPALVGQLWRRDEGNILGKREFWALEDVSFQVKRGEAFGIIGHNGAGKSTLLKVLSNIMKPTRGGIKINGKLSALIEVGAGFHPDLTGKENIFLNGLILGMSRAEIKQKFDEIVQFSGLDSFIDTPVKRYSSGMYARLGFSVAAHVNPDILLVDEVLSVGDWGFQRKCAEKMENLISSGATIIFISHNLRAVTNLCKRCILLDHGKIIKEGLSGEVVKNYLSGGLQTSNTDPKSNVFISKAMVLKDGQQESRLNAGDKVIVHMEVHSEIDCDDMALHIYMIDNTDLQIFHAYLELLDSGGFSIRKGESKDFMVELSMHLASGTYQLGILLVNLHDVSKIYDHKFPAAKLHIESHDAVRCVANLYPRILGPST